MRTDIPLKRLTTLRPADLLPLLDTPEATVLGVMTLELPTTATSLDTVLRLRTPDDQEYLHLVEWQGYRDPNLLWRTLGYLAWLGQHRHERPILVTVIYLTPGDDVGETLQQELAGQPGWMVTLPCVRLWQQDATTMLAREAPGLATLSPLMANATAESVEQAISIITTQAPEAQQTDLLTILGVFAEPLFDSERFKRLVGKERLMASDLLTSLMEEKTAELEAQLAQRLAEKQAEMEFERAQERAAHAAATTLQSFQQTLEEAVIARFPDAPIALAHDIRQVRDLTQLQQLIVAVVRAADLDVFRRELAQALTSDQ